MSNIKRNRFLSTLSVFVIVFTFAIVFGTRAQEMGDVLSSWVDKDSISVYVQGTKDIDVKVQIGTKKIKDVEVVPLDEIEKIETLILIDNSLSTTEDTRPIITEMLTGVVGNRLSNESISIATFSKNIDYKVKDTTDYTELKRTVDSLEYKYQDAYLLPTIYDLIKDYATDDENIFRRVIIVSDGASDEEIGVTVSEVISELNKFTFPIYTFGCQAEDGSNNSDLENLYSIARATGAEYWTINEIDSPEDVSSEFSKRLAEIDRIDIKVPKSLRDGSEKGVKISMINGGLRLEASTAVKMPFDEATNIKLPLSAFILLIVVAVMVIVLLVVLLVILTRKKHDDSYQEILDELNDKGNKEYSEKNKKNVAQDYEDFSEVVKLNERRDSEKKMSKKSLSNNSRCDFVKNNDSSEEETLPNNIGSRVLQPTIVIKALNMTWERNLSRPIIIGRIDAVDIQLNNLTVSKEHCKIYFEQGNVYIEDLHSSNNTFIGSYDIAKMGRYKVTASKIRMMLGDVEVILEVLG
jgi:von willebrand factor type A domain